MNLIEREVQIIKTIRYIDNIKRKFNRLNEENNDKYISTIKKYKVFKNNENLKDYWPSIYDSDQRRYLLKDDNGYFNYIPAFNIGENNKNKDLFAKNENEILYHYLYYKTLLCKNCDLSIENEEEELCPYAHNILKDFRIIYDYKDEIRDFMRLLLESNLFNFEDYHKYIPINIKFNINTVKVHKCLEEEKIGKCDCKICPFYHIKRDDDPPRRPPSLFKYSNCPCDSYSDKNSNKCLLGDFCFYIHNLNEKKFHPDNFTKELELNNEKNKMLNNKFNSTNLNKDKDNKEFKEDEEKENINNIEEENEDIKIEKYKIKNLCKIGKIVICRKCNKVDQSGQLCYFIKCKHFICKKCFKKLNKERKKENNNKISFICPFCKIIRKENKVALFNFGNKEE